ncbi:MAG: hypothetical protein K2M55_09170, partial [Muribaculaceae bacterium]|nr:hypothetical protein [Muribaculaceae bacterium]
MFKHFLTACLAVLLSAGHMHALKPEDVPVPDGMVTGFIGAPLLKTTGWKAEPGAFNINLGIV